MSVGIVTRVDESHFYVWALGHGYKEFRCRKVPEKDFKHGELIHFTLPNEHTETLDATRCERANRQLKVLPSVNCIWKAECLITFAPQEFDVLKEIQEQLPDCKALAFSDEFCYVANFTGNTHIKVGDVYQSYVTRLPPKYDEWIPKLGTPFCIVNKFTKIFDREKSRELLRKAPWTKIMGIEHSRRNSSLSIERNIPKKVYSNPNLFDESPDDEEKEENIKQKEPPTNKKSNIFQIDDDDFQIISSKNSEQNKNVENKQNNSETILKNPAKEIPAKKIPIKENPAKESENLTKNIQDEENDEMKVYTGLVIEADNFGLVLWNRTHDLVRAPGLPLIGLEKRWPISTWVNYRAFFDDASCSQQQQQNAHENRCRYTAYDIFTSEVDRQVIFRKSENTIRMECQIYGPVRYVGDDLMIVNEPFLGIVLCAKDMRLIQRLDYGWSEYVTAFVTFTKEYPDLCRWIALAIKPNVDSDWTELEKPLITQPLISECASKTSKENVKENKELLEENNAQSENDQQVEQAKCSAFNGVNTSTQKRSHRLHSISTGLCDFSINSTLPSSSTSPLTNNNNNINNNNNLLLWDEYDENNEDNQQEEIRKSPPRQTPKLIEIDDLRDKEGCDYLKERHLMIEQELRSYAPMVQKHDRVRATGIIVQKTLHYAVIYASDIGLAIVIANLFPSLQQYDTLCNIGNWITATFANVANKLLIFSKMCLPKFEKAEQKYPKTRICKDGKLQVLISCDISLNNLYVYKGIKRKSGGLRVLDTPFARILLNERFIFENKLPGTLINMWVTYMENSSEHGPFWENEDNSFTLNNDSDDEEFLFKALDLGKIGLTADEFCSLFIQEEEEKKNNDEENEEFSIIPYQPNYEPILPSFDASEIAEIDFSPPQQHQQHQTPPQELLPGFSIREYANKYLGENFATDFIEL
ncbi:hypothetical protein ACQ4LE_004233 [Meloidogyne hapla]